MNPPKVLLLGGNRSNVPSIRAAKAAGFTVIVVDPHADSPALTEADIALAADVREQARMLEFIDECGGVDGIVSMSEAGVESAAELSGRLGLPSISIAAASNARSKAQMRRLWAGSEFSVEFEVVRSETDALQAVERMGLPLVFKPDRSFGGSRGVLRVESKSEVSNAFHFAVDDGEPNTSVVIERVLTGSEHSCEVLLHNGECWVVSIGEKVKSDAPYRVDLSVRYPAALMAAQERSIEEMCTRATALLGLTHGAAHVEFAMTADGPVLFEIGARAGGGHTPQLVYAASGVDEFLEICRMACGCQPLRLHPVQGRGAEYRFLIFPPGQISGVTIPDEVRNHPDVIDVDVLVKPGTTLYPVRTVSDRAGFVVTHADHLSKACEIADWACARIVAEYTDGSSSSAMLCGDREVAH